MLKDYIRLSVLDIANRHKNKTMFLQGAWKGYASGSDNRIVICDIRPYIPGYHNSCPPIAGHVNFPTNSVNKWIDVDNIPPGTIICFLAKAKKYKSSSGLSRGCFVLNTKLNVWPIFPYSWKDTIKEVQEKVPLSKLIDWNTFENGYFVNRARKKKPIYPDLKTVQKEKVVANKKNKKRKEKHHTNKKLFKSDLKHCNDYFHLY